MKVQISSVNCVIPLTERQWEILRRKEDAHDNRTEKYVFFPTTWKFKGSDNITNWEWNGHFGRAIFFTASEGAQESVVKFLTKYLK